MRRTKEDAAKTRQEILQAAEALFLERGYENVTLEHIAASAGITRGAIHWHFKNKQGLLFALREEPRFLFEELADRFTKDPLADPLDALARTIAGLFEKLHSDPRRRGVLRMMMYLDLGLSVSNAPQRDMFKCQVQDSFIRLFEAAEKRSQFAPPWTPRSAALSLTAVISGLVGEWVLNDNDFALIPDGMNIIELLLGAWSAPSKAADLLK